MIKRVDFAVKVGVCVRSEFDGVVPRPWFGEFVEILFLEQIGKIPAPFWNHFLKCFGLLPFVGFGGKVNISMKPEELQRFSSIQAQRVGQTLARNPSRPN